MGYIKQAKRIPCEVKRIAIDGDIAFVHRDLRGAGTLLGSRDGRSVDRDEARLGGSCALRKKPLVSISSALIWMARSSSTGMCCNPCLPSPTTPTQCSNTGGDWHARIAGIRMFSLFLWTG
jgi:hypothetical protein